MEGRSLQLETLRAQIARIEQRPPLAGSVTGLVDGSAEAGLQVPAGVLAEVYADEQRNGGAALGFALGLAQGLLSAERPALVFLELTQQGQEMGLPYGPGLGFFGIDPLAMVIGRLASITDLLWALEEAVMCRAVAGVVADIAGSHKALDFTASRRLSLRAASAGTTVFMLRYGRAREASAAALRWRIEPVLSAPHAFDARAPSGPRWQVELEKGRLFGKRQKDGGRMLLDWTDTGRERYGMARVEQAAGGGAGERSPAASGAQSAALGDRLSQAS